MGYSPWGCKESDMNERLHFTSYIYIYIYIYVYIYIHTYIHSLMTLTCNHVS